MMTTRAANKRRVLEQFLIEEIYPEGRVAARVSMRRDPSTGELRYTPSALRRLDRLRAMLQDIHETSTPGHIKSLREAFGLTQEQFAARVGVTGQTVSRWERGETKPKTNAVRRLRALQAAARKRGLAVPIRTTAALTHVG